MSFEVSKAQAWLGIGSVLVMLIVAFANLFTSSSSHETRLEKLEKRAEERDKELAKTLEEIKASVNFANWNIGAITKQLEQQK